MPDPSAAQDRPWTKGEWVAAPVGAYADFDGQSRVILADDIRVAVVHAGGRDPAVAAENEANARLIAAAPDLYRMTELLERSVVYEIKKSESEGDDEGARMKSFTLAEVRAVLAKARGETDAR